MRPSQATGCNVLEIAFRVVRLARRPDRKLKSKRGLAANLEFSASPLFIRVPDGFPNSLNLLVCDSAFQAQNPGCRTKYVLYKKDPRTLKMPVNRGFPTIHSLNKPGTSAASMILSGVGDQSPALWRRRLIQIPPGWERASSERLTCAFISPYDPDYQQILKRAQE